MRFSLFLLALLGTFSIATETVYTGVQVSRDGSLLKNGQPIRAFGVNYMDAFTRTLEIPENTSYRAGFKTLAAHHIPFARLNFGGFYAVNWKRYQEDRAGYFALMDGVVRTAEETGVGLVPSLFWWTAAIPDLVGEPVGQWGNPESKTHAFMREYIREVVTRYKDSPAIWGWEFGNEYSLAVDLPNAADHRPAAHPSLGGPGTRSAADDLTSEMVRTATAAFATEIRKYDPHRPITTGHSLPRPSAHHQRTELSWKQDSVEQMGENMVHMTPDPLDTISIHIYPFSRDKRFSVDQVSYAQLFAESARVAREAGKALFVGEYGPPADNQAPWTPETAREEGLAMLQALEASPVQWAALWVFDFPWQDHGMNITADNHRSVHLTALREVNLRFLAGKS